MRLRNKFIASFLAVALPAILGTAYAVTRVFVWNQQSYLTELNSIAAPNIAMALERHLRHLQGQLQAINEVLKSVERTGKREALLEASFRSLEGVRRLEVHDERGPAAFLGLPQSTKPYSSEHVVETLGASASARLFRPGKSLLYGWRIGTRVFLLELEPDVFQPYLEMARALSVALVGPEGLPLVGEGLPSPDLSRFLASVSEQRKHSLVARELTVGSRRYLAAVAVVPSLEGISVLVQAPALSVADMLEQALRKSLFLLAAVIAVALLLAMFLSRHVVRPLELLTEAAARIGAGQWKMALPIQARDELGTLARSFVHMGQELEGRETDLKRAHEELLRSEKLSAVGQFSAGVAHEVKNPLTSILGFGQLVQQRLPSNLDPEIPKFMGYILDETRRASRIISDLLLFSRQKPPALSVREVSRLLTDIVERTAPQAGAAKVKIELEAAADSMRVAVDSDQMQQVFSNLLTNALHALEGTKDARVIVMAHSSDRGAVIEVSDNGPGINPEHLPKIFEPFFTTKGFGKGTGLGLSLCHSIVSQHRGKIEVVSEAGRGTTFRVILPLAD